MMYERSSAIAVMAKIAFTAIPLARSSRPGRMPMIVTNQIARKGVCVHELMWPKNPRSGRPVQRRELLSRKG